MLAVAAALLVWLEVRAPLVAPISLYAASSSTVGFYSTGHIIAAMAAAAGLAALVAAIRGMVRLPPWPVLLGLALPLGAMTLATAHAIYPHDARINLAIAVAMALFALTTASWVGNAGRAALWLTVLGGCVLAALAFHQFALGQPSPLAWTGTAAIPVRVTATLRNPNVLGAVLLLCLGSALALEPWGLLAVPPLTAALLLTFSRGAWLGLAAAAVITLLLSPRRRWVAVAIGLMAVTALAVHVRVPAVALRASSISVGASSNTSRFFTWVDALGVFWSHRWTGVGPGGLEALYAAMAPLGWHGNFIYTVVPSSADNDLIEWAAEGGLVAVASLLAGVVLVAVAIRRGARRTLAAPLIAALVGVAVQGMFEVTAYALPVEALMAWIFALLLAGAGCLREHRLRWSRLAALPVLAGAAALSMTLFAVWPAYQAFQAGFQTFAAGHPAAAVPALVQAANLDPASERAQAAAGDAAVLAVYAGKNDAAVAESRMAAALRLDPYDGSSWSVVSALETKLGKKTAAVCTQEAAVHTRPYDPFQAYTLAQQLTAIGDAAAGRRDLAYAAWTFGPTIAVMKEHGEPAAYVKQAEQDAAQAAKAGAPPAAPLEPLSAAACAPALASARLPQTAWLAAMGTRAPNLGKVGQLLTRAGQHG